MDLSPEERQAFYQKQVDCLTPPRTLIQELLLRVYENLLDGDEEPEGGSVDE